MAYISVYSVYFTFSKRTSQCFKGCFYVAEILKLPEMSGMCCTFPLQGKTVQVIVKDCKFIQIQTGF